VIDNNSVKENGHVSSDPMGVVGAKVQEWGIPIDVCEILWYSN